jgi:hypothetical protein
MSANAAFKDVAVREYEVIDAPTAITAPVLHDAETGLS